MITEQRIQLMISKRALDSLYSQVKFEDLELLVERSGKEQKQIDNYFLGKPVYDAIVEDLRSAISDKVWLSLTEFIPELTNILSKSTTVI